MSSSLFSPITLRSLTFRNRIGVSPMCQYSAENGRPTDWHMVHLGGFATGGAALVMAEATAVVPEGRISPYDTGIWNDDHVDAWRPIAKFIEKHGAVPAIQLAHAGIKASTLPSWEGGKFADAAAGGWTPVGVRNTPFHPEYPSPRAMDIDDIDAVVDAFDSATHRALAAGFKLIEIHAAHGYLLHSFYSPLMNDRTDDYGGSFGNRIRLLLRVAEQTRATVSANLPVAVRLSCSDWVEGGGGGWTIDDSVRLSKRLRDLGIDLIDCSSGGATRDAKIPVGPGFQVPFADQIRREAKIPTAAVGMITDPTQADTILRTGQADFVFLARALLRDPHWPTRAAKELGVDVKDVAPKQYARAW